MTPLALSIAESPLDCAHLLTAARAGSREALGQLLENCRSYLLFVARAHLDRERADVSAADLVQDALVLAIAGFGGFHGNDEPQLLAWLRRILLNRLANLSARSARRTVALRPQDEPADGTTPSWLAMIEESAETMRRALDQLAADYQRVLTLRYVDRMKWEEIGVRLDRSSDAARMIHFRALRELGRLLNPPGP
ncbi:MAG: RNA polymerase sigma factor [Gemmataceae bacterium]|nr:RNA polymerase sigma factor [Gemmataceae bacterium]